MKTLFNIFLRTTEFEYLINLWIPPSKCKSTSLKIVKGSREPTVRLNLKFHDNLYSYVCVHLLNIALRIIEPLSRTVNLNNVVPCITSNFSSKCKEIYNCENETCWNFMCHYWIANKETCWNFMRHYWIANWKNQSLGCK